MSEQHTQAKLKAFTAYAGSELRAAVATRSRQT